MAVISGIDAGIAGWKAALKSLDRTAQQIASNSDEVDPAQSMVDLKVAETSAKANLKTIKTADEMIGTLLDLVR